MSLHCLEGFGPDDYRSPGILQEGCQHGREFDVCPRLAQAFMRKMVG